MVSVRGLVGDDSTVLSSGSAICVQALMAPHGNPVHFDVVLDCFDSTAGCTMIESAMRNIIPGTGSFRTHLRLPMVHLA